MKAAALTFFACLVTATAQSQASLPIDTPIYTSGSLSPDWNFGSPPPIQPETALEKWVYHVVIVTGGVGAGIGTVLVLLMSASICIGYCWCCPKGKCCCCFPRQTCCYCCAEHEPRSSHRTHNHRNYLIIYAVFGICSCLAAGLVAYGVQEGVSGMSKNFAGVVEFKRDTGDRICSRTVTSEDLSCSDIIGAPTTAQIEAKKNQCGRDSLLWFMYNVEQSLYGVLDESKASLLNFGNDMLGLVHNASNRTNDVIVNTKDLLEQVEKAVNASADVVNKITQINEIFVNNSLPKPVDENLVPDIQKLKDQTKKAEEEMTKGQNEIAKATKNAEATITKTLHEDAVKQIDNAKEQTQKLVCDVSKQSVDHVYDNALMNNIETQSLNMDKAVTSVQTAVMGGAAGLMFIAAVLPFCCGFIGKSRNGLIGNKCGCCWILAFIFIVCLMMGVTGVAYRVLDTACDSLEPLITTNLDSIAGSNINVTLDGRVYEFSPLGDKVISLLNCKGNTNLVGIMGLTELFNVSSKIDPFRTELIKAEGNTESIERELNKTSADAKEAKTQFEEPILGQDNQTYTGSALENVAKDAQKECDKNVTVTYQGQTVTVKVSSSNPKVYPACANDTAELLSLIQKMNAEVAQIETAKQDASATVDRLIQVITDAEGVLQTLPTYINNIWFKVVGVADSVPLVVDTLKCKFIGDAYRTIIKDGTCTDVVSGFMFLYIGCAMAVAVMTIGFCVLVPWRVKPTEEEKYLTGEGTFAEVPIHVQGDSQFNPTAAGRGGVASSSHTRGRGKGKAKSRAADPPAAVAIELTGQRQPQDNYQHGEI